MEADYGWIDSEDVNGCDGVEQSSVASLFPCSVDLSGFVTQTQAKLDALAAEAEALESQYYCDDDDDTEGYDIDSSDRSSRIHSNKARQARGSGPRQQDTKREGQQRRHAARQHNAGNAPTKWESIGPRRGKRGKPRTYGDGMMIFYQRVSTPFRPLHYNLCS